jgi:hypothetical protein
LSIIPYSQYYRVNKDPLPKDGKTGLQRIKDSKRSQSQKKDQSQRKSAILPNEKRPSSLRQSNVAHPHQSSTVPRVNAVVTPQGYTSPPVGYHCRYVSLFEAVKYGDVSDVKNFSKNWEHRHIDQNNENDGSTLLHWAAHCNSDVLVLEYLIFQGADVNATNIYGSTPLHRAAAYNSNVKVLVCLVSHGAYVNAKNYYGDTPLHFAIRNNADVKVLRYLVSQGANIYAKDRNGRTPLDIADTENKERTLREAVRLRQ